MIEAYETNRALRETYLRMNAITHAEILDSENGYIVYMCSANGVGFPESQEFSTVGKCHEWVNKYCPELSIK